jgi:hypothetical protein
MTEQSNGSGARLAPPYFPWNALLSIVQRMATEEPPTRIDKSYLDKHSGATQTAILSGLRWLDLIGEDGRLTEAFIRLAEADDAQRKQAIGDLLRSRYGVIVEMGTTNATQQELEEAFKAQFDSQGETRRKAVAFYLKAAQYAGVPVSRHWKTPRTTVPRSGTRGRRGAKPGTGQDSQHVARTPSVSEDDMKRIYFNLLVEKAQQAEKPESDLLNRIERVIGISGEGSESGRSQTGLRSEDSGPNRVVPGGSIPTD